MTLIGTVTQDEIQALKRYIQTDMFLEEYDSFLKTVCTSTGLALKVILRTKLAELRDGARLIEREVV